MNDTPPPVAPAQIDLPPALREDLEEADALPEIAVLYAPTPDVLEAYALEARLGVIAVVPGGAAERTAALEAGALEVLDPDLDEAEARARLATAVARFRSRIHLEEVREALDIQAEELERDLRLAARLQRSLLPRALPDAPEVRFSTAHLPREFVSGDSYELQALGPDHVAIYTLDAVGHGVRAGLLTVLLRTQFRPLKNGKPRPPAKVVSDLNARLVELNLEESPTAAFCYALLERSTGKLQVVNAGHPLPTVIHPDGTSDQLDTSGLLLGIDQFEYGTSELTLEPGARIFFFTDGADTNYDNRFVDQLGLHRDLDLEDQIGGALGAVIKLDDEGRPEDDITVVGLEYLGPPAAL